MYLGEAIPGTIRRLTVSLFAGVVVTIGGCEKPQSAAPIVRPVRVMKVQDVSVLTDRSLPGRAEATQEVNLAFRVAGPLVELKANVGDKVKKDDTIARIDPRDFQVSYRGADANLAAAKAQLKAMRVGARPEEIEQLRASVQRAEATLKLATNDLRRVEPLVESRTISRAEYDQYVEAHAQADASFRQAREELQIGERGARPEDIEAKEADIRALEAAAAAAKNQWVYTYLRAPFDGTVVAKYVDNYEDVQAKQPIVRLLDSSQIEMVVNVPESAISLVQYVTDITCVFDAFPGVAVPAKVKEIGAEASRTTRTYPVNLIMEQPKDVTILPGMAGQATGRVKRPEELAGAGIEIPASAVFERDAKSFVWIIESSDGKQGQATAREVSLGELSARGVNVVEGIRPGDVIATAGVDFLEEGQTVRLVDQSA
jgi:RND family efflux transporter MFP subunit